MGYQERLDEVDAAFAVLMEQRELLLERLRVVLEDRPCDFYLEYKGKRWIQYHDSSGNKSSHGWSITRADHPAVHRETRYKKAKEYADYLEKLKNITGIEIKEIPRVDNP